MRERKYHFECERPDRVVDHPKYQGFVLRLPFLRSLRARPKKNPRSELLRTTGEEEKKKNKKQMEIYWKLPLSVHRGIKELRLPLECGDSVILRVHEGF